LTAPYTLDLFSDMNQRKVEIFIVEGGDVLFLLSARFTYWETNRKTIKELKPSNRTLENGLLVNMLKN
jgi:hypothetical protein